MFKIFELDPDKVTNHFYTTTDINNFIKINPMPLIQIENNQFNKVTDLDKKETEPISWEDLKKRIAQSKG